MVEPCWDNAKASSDSVIQEAPAKKADKSAASESTKRKKDKKETAANAKEAD